MPDLVFRDPPPPKFGPQTWVKRVVDCQQHPGRWIDATDTWGVGRGNIKTARSHGLEAVEAKVDGSAHLFVRWPEGTTDAT
jgi:hypothetical protein